MVYDWGHTTLLLFQLRTFPGAPSLVPPCVRKSDALGSRSYSTVGEAIMESSGFGSMAGVAT